LGFDYQNI